MNVRPVRCRMLSVVSVLGHDIRASGSNLYGQVRSFVRDFIAQEQGVALDEDKLLTALHEKRIIEELIGSLGKEPERLTPASSSKLSGVLTWKSLCHDTNKHFAQHTVLACSVRTPARSS